LKNGVPGRHWTFPTRVAQTGASWLLPVVPQTQVRHAWLLLLLAVGFQSSI